MLLNTQHFTEGQKLAKTLLCAINFGMVWFRIVKNPLSEAITEFPSSSTFISFPICHSRPKIVQSHGFVIFVISVWFGLVMDLLK